jgi:hypothetical protein
MIAAHGDYTDASPWPELPVDLAILTELLRSAP